MKTYVALTMVFIAGMAAWATAAGREESPFAQAVFYVQ